MSMEQAIKSLTQYMPQIISSVNNGECRILTRVAGNGVDDQGFLSPESRDFTGYIPCVWKVKSTSTRDAAEMSVAAQVRGFFRYEITLPKLFQNECVTIKTADRIELKKGFGDIEPVTLEVVAPVDQSVLWLIVAIDVDAP